MTLLEKCRLKTPILVYVKYARVCKPVIPIDAIPYYLDKNQAANCSIQMFPCILFLFYFWLLEQNYLEFVFGIRRVSVANFTPLNSLVICSDVGQAGRNQVARAAWAREV